MEQPIERDAREKRRTAPVADGAARNIGAGASVVCAPARTTRRGARSSWVSAWATYASHARNVAWLGPAVASIGENTRSARKPAALKPVGEGGPAAPTCLAVAPVARRRKPVGEGGPGTPKPVGEGGSVNTHRSDTMKLTTLRSPTAMALPRSGGRPSASTRISIRMRLPRIDINPVATLNRTNRANVSGPANLPNPPNLLSAHVHHSCHTKLCSTAASTAAAVACSQGQPASEVSTESVSSCSTNPRHPTITNFEIMRPVPRRDAEAARRGRAPAHCVATRAERPRRARRPQSRR